MKDRCPQLKNLPTQPSNLNEIEELLINTVTTSIHFRGQEVERRK